MRYLFDLFLILSTTYSVCASTQHLRADRRLQSNPAFIEQNGVVMISAESVPIVSPWKFENNVNGYTGPGYLRFDGNSVYGGSPVGQLSYFIQIETPGNYQLTMRVRRNLEVESHLGNDCYISMPGQPGYLGQVTKAYMAGSLPTETWRWFTKLEVDHEAGFFPEPVYNLQPGTYELQVWGRSKNFSIDRLLFWKTDTVDFDFAKDKSRPESFRVGDDVPDSTGTDVRLTKLELVTAGTPDYQVIQELKDGDTIDFKDTGDNLSVLASYNGTVYQVRFFYDGIEWVEGGAPYSMRGDKVQTTGEINVVEYLKTTGSKNLVVTANVPSGQSTGNVEVDFTIVDTRNGGSSTPALTPVPTPSPTPLPTSSPAAPVSIPTLTNTDLPPLSQGRWIETDSNAPINARHEACFVMVDNDSVGKRAYLVGGRGIRDLDIYDPLSRSWSKGPRPPASPTSQELHHMQCVAVDGKLWIAAAWKGVYPVEDNADHVYMYDPATNTWAEKTPMPEARRRGSAAVIAVGKRIYVSHGNRGGHEQANQDNAVSLGWLDFYDTETDTWTAMTGMDAPNPRDHTGGALIGNKICVAGGRNGGVPGWPSVAPTDCFDLTTNTWEVKASIPNPRAGSSYGQTCDGKLMVAGGEGDGKAWNNVDVFDGESWTTIDSLNIQRHGSGLAVDCDCETIIVASGNDKQGGGSEIKSVETFFYSGSDTQCGSTPVTSPPTPMPTKSPTIAPTPSPTKTPTKMPTRMPTKLPTSAPSKAPTKGTPSPTLSPVTDAPIPTAPVTEAPVTTLAPVTEAPVASPPSNDFFVDSSGSGGPSYSIEGPSWLWSTQDPVDNVPTGYTNAMFQSHRIASPTLTYVISGFVPLSNNQISLGFAEMYGPNCEIGKRVLNVSVNGAPFLSNYDIFAKVGCKSVAIESGSFPASSSGEYSVAFTAIVENPMVSTIKIEGMGEPVSPSPTTPPTKMPTTMPTRTPTGDIDLQTVAPTNVPTPSPTRSPTSPPTKAPTPAPVQPTAPENTSAPTPASTNLWDNLLAGECFSGVNTVEVYGSHQRKPMSEVAIGDVVRTHSGFSRVYTLGHIDETVVAHFLQIHTTDFVSPLELTPGHMVFVKNRPVRAEAVKVGDRLGNSTVTSIRQVTRQGIYAPVTEDGTIVVSGVLSSCFVAPFELPTLFQHATAQVLLSPRRVSCWINFDICQGETYTDGQPDFVWKIFQGVKWLSGLSGVVRFVVLILLAFPIVVTAFAEQLLLCSPIGLVTASLISYLLASKRRKGVSMKAKCKKL